MILNYLGVFPMVLYINWFFNLTFFSLRLLVAFHLSFNLVNVIWFLVTSVPVDYAIFIGLIWVVVLLILPGIRAKIAFSGNYPLPSQLFHADHSASNFLFDEISLFNPG